MLPQTQKLLEEVLQLPLADREMLTSQLCESLDDEFADEAAWSAEIKRRVDELKAGTVQTIPWEQVRQKMLDYTGEPARD